MNNEILKQIVAADKIRMDADAEHDRATAILIRKLGGKTLWRRATDRQVIQFPKK